jgi:di/tricarboxylate transporter
MTSEQILALGIFALTMLAFVWDRLRYDVVALAALLACVLAGLVKPEAAFLGFGNPAVITVAAVLVLSYALARGGVVTLVGERLNRLGTSPVLHIVLLCSVGAAISAFMNNVGALALVMPVAIGSARACGYPPALVLMPLSFATMLGGTITLIGTPPNLLAAGFRERYGEPPFEFFAFLPVGLAVTVAGIVYLALIGWRLLPRDRAGAASALEQFDPGHYVTEIRLPEGSSFVKQTVAEVEAAQEHSFTVVSLFRHGIRVHGRTAHLRLAAGDELVVAAESELLQSLVRKGDVELIAAKSRSEQDDSVAERPDIVACAEVVVRPNSWLQGATARGLQLRARYGVNLLALSRQGRPVQTRLREVQLHPGDVLLLEGDPATLPDAIKQLGCLPLANRKLALTPFQILLPLGIFVAAILLVVFDVASAPIAFMLGVLAVVLTRVVPLLELYEAVDWPVIVLLGAMIPVGGVLESTGLSGLIAERIAALSSGLADIGVLGVVLVGTMLVTPLLNNATTVIVMAPLAIGIAQSVGLRPDAFLMAVAIGASCDFLTPFGHQNNTLILAPGGYRFSDYWKLGLPLDVVVVAAALATLPLVFPLR